MSIEIPYDVKLIIYRYVHEMNMHEILIEMIYLIKSIDMARPYIRERCLHPYTVVRRLCQEINQNQYGVSKLYKCVHYKKMRNSLNHIVRPSSHVVFED